MKAAPSGGLNKSAPNSRISFASRAIYAPDRAMFLARMITLNVARAGMRQSSDTTEKRTSGECFSRQQQSILFCRCMLRLRAVE